MERLQEALKRAREQREELGAGAPPATGDAAQADAPAQAQRQSSAHHGQDPWEAVPEFAPIPRIMRKNRLISYFGGPEASPYDIMRTKIVQLAKAKEAKRIIVTSPSPGCGKTTTTANLAFSLARQADLRTLVLDIDFRRPNLGKVLGIQEPHQFSEALANESDPAEHMVRIGSNLLIATNAEPAANPSELLQSQVAQETLAELERRFEPDLVLFDALPVLTSDDTIGFVEHCDAALIVAAAEQNSMEELDVTEAEIAAVSTVLGVVLNKCRYAGNNYEYY
ncbi:MAG: CpsD/CapB family tyrosine-protein kinase [Mangrovicoccus sp.]|nr:CpsD/CapB family tyrosine-protein kinase [Mangrovicoccus sp.]